MEAKVEKIQNEIADHEENSLKIQRKQIKEIDVLKQEIEKLKSGAPTSSLMNGNSNSNLEVKPFISRDPSRSDLDSFSNSNSNFATTTFTGSQNFGTQQQQNQQQQQQNQQQQQSPHISNLPASLSSGNLNSFASPSNLYSFLFICF